MWLDATGDPWVRGGFCGRINGNPEVAMAVELVDEYRKSELRLRLLLMGDGSESPGLVKGDEHRQSVGREIRRLRETFEALVEDREAAGTPHGLDDELRMIASFRAHGDAVEDDTTLLTPYAVAVLLRVSPSTVYRAIQRGQIQAERSPDTPRGKLRIAASEVQKWVEREREQERATSVAL